MFLLLVFLILFGVLHVLPALPALKARVAGPLGKAYGPAYGIASLLLLVECIWSFRQISPEALYDVPAWGRHGNFALSLIGFVFLGIFLFRGSWRNVIRHPMALGVGFWATGHLLANGDKGTTLLFGGFLVIAIIHALLRQTQASIAPSPVREGHNLLSILAGVALYGLAIQVHHLIAGVPVIQLS